MKWRLGARGIAGVTLIIIIGVNELLAVMGRANLLDQVLTRILGRQVTPAFDLLVILFALALILAVLIHQRTDIHKAPQVTPRLVACGERSLMLDPGDVSMGPGKPEDALLAVMAAFEYDPILASGPRVSVRAEIWFEQQGSKYRGGGTIVHVGSGYWRDAPRNQALFHPGVRHELIVAVDHRGSLLAIQDERGDRSDLRPTTMHLGQALITPGHNVKIKLIQLDETTHQRLAVNTFHYVLNLGEHQLDLLQVEE